MSNFMCVVYQERSEGIYTWDTPDTPHKYIYNITRIYFKFFLTCF